MKRMRRIFPAVLTAGTLIVLMSLPGTAAVAGSENDPPTFQGRQLSFTIIRPLQAAPATPLHTLKGGVTTLRRFAGKVVLLNIWATWCPACLHEMPSLDRLQARIGGDKFTVVSLSVDRGGAKDVLPYLKRLGITRLPVYLDPAGRTAEAIEVHEGLPWSFIIDHRGRVMGYLKGAGDWESDEGLALIRYYTRRIPR